MNIKTIVKVILIIFGIVILVCGIFILIVFSAFGGFDKDYSVSDLIENHNKKQREISDLITFYETIVPKDKIVEIEFESDSKIYRFGIYSTDSTKNKENFLDWDLTLGSKRTDSIIKTINWNTETLHLIKNKLDKANCIAIRNGNISEVGFQRSGLGMYFFYIPHKPMSKKQYGESGLNSCENIYVSEKLILHYGSPAFGSTCFPGYSY